MKKIGFTGTQIGMSEAQVKYMTQVLTKDVELHHGDCIGADAKAYELGFYGGSRLVCHPPKVSSKRAFSTKNHETRDPKPYLERNRDIVNETEELYATPKGPEEPRSGTWATVRYARKLGRPITIVYPDGRVEKENQ